MIDLLQRTLEFTAPTIFMIFLGLFGAGLLEELGLLHKLSFLARPLVTVARLPDVCASAFVVSIGSTIAANGMIARMRDEDLLNDHVVVLSAIMNSIPAYLREIFTYQLPIVIPALGLLVGGLYGMVFMVTAFLKILIVILLGRMLLEDRRFREDNFREYVIEGQNRAQNISSPNARMPLKRAIISALQSQLRISARIAALYFTMTLLIFLLSDHGAFEALSVLPLASLFGLPAESILPLTTYVASPVMGISMLGPLIQSGGVSAVQAMVVLMLGSIFMLPIFALRSQVPRYTAFFGMRLGLFIIIFSTGVSILVRLAVLLILLGFF